MGRIRLGRILGSQISWFLERHENYKIVGFFHVCSPLALFLFTKQGMTGLVCHQHRFCACECLCWVEIMLQSTQKPSLSSGSQTGSLWPTNGPWQDWLDYMHQSLSNLLIGGSPITIITTEIWAAGQVKHFLDESQCFRPLHSVGRTTML